jgi:hypothetical protein
MRCGDIEYCNRGLTSRETMFFGVLSAILIILTIALMTWCALIFNRNRGYKFKIANRIVTYNMIKMAKIHNQGVIIIIISQIDCNWTSWEQK